MGRRNSPGLIHILVLVFATGGCSIGIHALTARTKTPHRTSLLNQHDIHLVTPHSMKHKLKHSLEQDVRVRKRLMESVQTMFDDKAMRERPSKRFHQYLTMARDVFPSRRSHTNPVVSVVSKGSSMVPVIDHFAGVKMWSVPYKNVDLETSTLKASVYDRKDGAASINSVTEVTQPILKQREKEAIFDREYGADRDLAQIPPGEALTKHDKPVLSGLDLLKQSLQRPPMELSNRQFSEGVYPKSTNSKNKDRGSADQPHGRRRDYSGFGTFKAFNPESYNDFDFDPLPFSNEQTFGKFVPSQSKFDDDSFLFSSAEKSWGRAKHRDLNQPGQEGDDRDPALRKTSGFQSMGEFNSDKGDCDNIEVKTCSTNDECSCFGLYTCTDGVCKRKSSFSDISRDDTDSGYWHSGPLRNEDLGVKP